MRTGLIAGLCAGGMALSGCAGGADSISPTYVSPMVYQNYDCNQIREEMRRINYRVAEVTGQQDRAARNDAVTMGVGLVLFWPALFFLANDNDKSAELSRLMGEAEAVQQAGIQNNCFTAEEREAIRNQRQS